MPIYFPRWRVYGFTIFLSLGDVLESSLRGVTLELGVRLSL